MKLLKIFDKRSKKLGHQPIIYKDAVRAIILKKGRILLVFSEEAEEFIASIPMQRIGDCEKDIGAFVVTLCSDSCRYVTGQSIAVDGGQANLG